ncbi:MAG: methyltransferase domain-containing protein [Candidatus Binataceae bacterium]
MLANLPLICPQCLALDRCEETLDARLECARCSTLYPQVEEIPVLMAEAALRESLACSELPADARSAFYHEATDYLGEPAPPAPEVAAALGFTRGDRLVLEIGSGRGGFAGLGGDDYCALDYSLTLLRRHLGKYRSICASAEAVPLRKGSCRFVFTVATLEHVPRADLAFAEINRLLSPGGVAYLAPAWHCRDWMADGLTVRPYRDLDVMQKARKLLIPLRNSLLYRGLQQIPWRLRRRILAKFAAHPSELRFDRLQANYERYWTSDSDACSSIDSHEGILYFETRGYEVLAPAGGVAARVFARGAAIAVRKLGRGDG